MRVNFKQISVFFCDFGHKLYCIGFGKLHLSIYVCIVIFKIANILQLVTGMLYAKEKRNKNITYS